MQPEDELQRIARMLLGLDLPAECLAGVKKCLEDLAVHIRHVRELTKLDGTDFPT
jgi:hypothetical protein